MGEAATAAVSPDRAPQGTRAARERTTARRRAVGTRDRIVAHLALVAEIADGTGMASTQLATAVGYPGSSVAFAQLLSGMERDGIIRREVRGKRTYRIELSAAHAARRAAEHGSLRESRSPGGPGGASVPVDYDELADRVILRLLRRISALDPAELAVLQRLLTPGRERAEELKIV